MTTSATTPFSYVRPSSVEEASRLLSRSGGSAALIAGGHSLIPLMKTRLVSPEVLIDLSAIDGLSGISSDTNCLNIGAMTSYEELESSDAVNEGAYALAEAAGQVADVQVRNWGTIGVRSRIRTLPGTFRRWCLHWRQRSALVRPVLPVQFRPIDSSGTS